MEVEECGTLPMEKGRDIVKSEGVMGLWRGNGVMMARVIPYAGVSFLSYPRYELAVKSAVASVFGRALHYFVFYSTVSRLSQVVPDCPRTH